jgi:hypothetical protein
MSRNIFYKTCDNAEAFLEKYQALLHQLCTNETEKELGVIFHIPTLEVIRAEREYFKVKPTEDLDSLPRPWSDIKVLSDLYQLAELYTKRVSEDFSLEYVTMNLIQKLSTKTVDVMFRTIGNICRRNRVPENVHSDLVWLRKNFVLKPDSPDYESYYSALEYLENIMSVA